MCRSVSLVDYIGDMLFFSFLELLTLNLVNKSFRTFLFFFATYIAGIADLFFLFRKQKRFPIVGEIIKNLVWILYLMQYVYIFILVLINAAIPSFETVFLLLMIIILLTTIYILYRFSSVLESKLKVQATFIIDSIPYPEYRFFYLLELVFFSNVIYFKYQYVIQGKLYVARSLGLMNSRTSFISIGDSIDLFVCEKNPNIHWWKGG